MGQVVKFFGMLVLGIGFTLVVFSHLSMGMVYGWDKLAQQVANDPVGTALSIVAFVPGALLYGLGVLIEKLGKRSDAKWAEEQAAAQATAQTEINSPTPPIDQAES